MLPLFRPGGIALAEPRPGARPEAWLRPGDCAVYEYRGERLLHRVLSTGRAGALLADDAGRLAPHAVPWEAVEGRVVSRHPLKSGPAGALYCRLRRKLYSLLNG